MVKLQSTTAYLLLFSIFFVIIVNCEKPRDDSFGPSQGNSDNYPGSFQGGKSETMMEPNIFKRFGSHLVKGWHGFKGLFGRKSNRREENNFGREEKLKPFEKETQINKEYPESNYNNYGNNGAYGSNQGGQKGNQEENQGYQVGVDERYKGGVQGEQGGKSDKGQKEEDKIYGIEESSNKPLDRGTKDNDKKSPQPVTNNGNNNFETGFGAGPRAYPAYKQRSRRRAPKANFGSYGIYKHINSYRQRFRRASGGERDKPRGIHRPRHYENPIRSFNHINQRADY